MRTYLRLLASFEPALRPEQPWNLIEKLDSPEPETPVTINTCNGNAVRDDPPTQARRRSDDRCASLQWPQLVAEAVGPVFSIVRTPMAAASTSFGYSRSRRYDIAALEPSLSRFRRSIAHAQ
jgi:hypothetical protein